MPTNQILGIVSIVPMGAWSASTTYQKLNLVRHNGVAYLAFGSSIAVEPGVSANWENIWMPVVYDGGAVSPDGTYPQLTAGQVRFSLLFGSKSYNGSTQQTLTAADLGLADVYKPQGGIEFADLPATPNSSNYGFVWNITDSFTTDSRFIEGAGHEYAAGTSVGVIQQNNTYYYSVLGSLADLSDYAMINGTYPEMTVGNAQQLGGVPASQYAQLSSLPTVGNIAIYTKDGKTAKWAVIDDINVSNLP